MTDLKGALVPIALLLVEGCGFGVPLKTPNVVPDQAARGATIRLGEATPAEARAALGEPWLASDRWRVEVYRADDKRTELGFAVAIVVPVPIGVFGEKRHGYVLVAYDETGRVAEVTPGSTSDGTLAPDLASWMSVRAGDYALVVDPVRTKPRTTLVAEPFRLAGYLDERRRSGECTVVAACDGLERCPRAVSIDGGEPFDTTPLSVLCAPDAPCPEGAVPTKNGVEGKRFALVPVMRAWSLSAGRHHLEGAGETDVDCAPGEVRYAVVGTEGTTLAPAAPGSWAGYRLVLARNGRWVVDGAGPPAPTR